MTYERGSPAESKNCEILSFPTADRRFDKKVKCPTGRASFWVKFPTVRSLTRVKCPGIARGGGGWAVLELTGTLFEMCDEEHMVWCSFKNRRCVKNPCSGTFQCVFLFLNAAMFRGISGQTRGANIKESQ